MSHNQHDGVFDTTRVYSHKAVARILGKTDRWTIANVFRKGLKYAIVGQLYITSGLCIQQWIESQAENFDGWLEEENDEPHPLPPAKENAGDEL